MYSNNLVRTFLTVVILVCNSANAAVPDRYKEPKLVKNLNAWIGKPISEVLSHPKFGVPKEKMVVGDKTFLTYKENLGIEGQINNNLTINILCKRIFVYNKADIITEVKEEGTCKDNQNYLPAN